MSSYQVKDRKAADQKLHLCILYIMKPKTVLKLCRKLSLHSPPFSLKGLNLIETASKAWKLLQFAPDHAIQNMVSYQNIKFINPKDLLWFPQIYC